MAKKIKTQEDKVYEYMLSGKEISQRKANYMGICRLAAVVWTMRHEMHIPVMSEKRRCENADGSISYPSFYWLSEDYIKSKEG